MGAELCVHILVGPRTLDESKRNTAIGLVEDFQKEYSKLDPEQRQEYAETFGFSVEDADEMMGVSAQGIVAEIFSFWDEPNARDASFRPYGEDRKIVVCGDQTWGDEPDGAGWQMCKRILFFDLGSILGIE